MKARLLSFFRFLLARPGLYRLNRFLFEVSLRGLGVRNYESTEASGERHFLRSILARPGGGERVVVLDVGANEGHYSQAVLANDPQALLYAFEPHPATYAKLIANVTAPGFNPINAAAGATAGVCQLFDYKSPTTSSHASLHKAVIEQLHASEAVGYEVKVVSLDEFALAQSIAHIKLLKIDTEGHEFQVLTGCRRLLAERRIEYIHFEFNEMNTVSRVFFRDFAGLLQGYDLFRMLPHGLLPLKEYDACSQEIFAYQNIVAKRRP